ncbi:MAG: hypothetical protein ACFBQW_04205 [Sphingomonadaceae bacterium]
MTLPEPSDEDIRARQKSRALVMGLLLAGLALLIYLITIARMEA